jgi:hypothetical protein
MQLPLGKKILRPAAAQLGVTPSLGMVFAVCAVVRERKIGSLLNLLDRFVL